MNNIKIYTDAKNMIFDRQKGKDDTFAAKVGDIIKATVVKVENQKATLYVNDKFSFAADINKIDAKLGDELLFEVVKSDKNSFTLKQLNIGVQSQNRKQLSTDEMIELFKQHGLYQEDIKADDSYIEDQKKAAEAVAKIKRKINYITGNATHSAINELIASGLSLEKISIDILNSVIREVESKGRSEISVDKTEEAVQKVKPKKGKDIDYREILKSGGLEANEQNIARLESVVSKWGDIKELDDDAIVSVLRSGKELTLENIYIAKYSTVPKDWPSAARNGSPNGKNEDGHGDNDWASVRVSLSNGKPADYPGGRGGQEALEELDDEIVKFLRREGFAVNGSNMELSKLIIANDIPLTADNLNKALFLRDIDKFDLDKILSRACENIKNDRRISEIEIFIEKQNEASAALLDEYRKTREALPEITAHRVEYVIRSGRDLNIRNLLGINIPRALMPETLSDEALSAKRRLTEIQLKLTSEAAIRLANKNININTMPIQEALETLRHLEKQSYENNFKIMGVPATDENIDEITDLYDKIRGIKPVEGNVFGDIITKKIVFSVNGVHESVSAARLTENYESSGTRVSSKYGDSFSKVEGQFEDLLKNLGLEATKENVRAAVILSRNNLEVNEENILRVKNIDSKINAIYDRLHPNIAVDMIKNNMNPANMHVDEVLEYIDRFNDAYGVGVKEKLANYIMEIDRMNILSDITRESMIAVYRMLSMIQRDGSAALGVSVGKDSELTLGNLFSDAKYFQRTKAKKTDIDMKVDDMSDIKVRREPDGGVMRALNSILDENAMGKTENNYKMGMNALNNDNENKNLLILRYERLSLTLGEIMSRANAAALSQIMEENPDYMELPLEDIIKLLEEKSGLKSELINERYVNMINDMQNIPAQVIRWMEENNIPATLNNVFAAANLLKKPHFIADKLNELQMADEINLPRDFGDGSLLERLTAMSEALPQPVESGMPPEAAERVRMVQNAVKVQNYIHQRPNNGYFQIPVKLHDKIGGVNMYVLNENLYKSDEARIYMSLDTTNLGNVSMYINVSGENAWIKVCAPDLTSLRRLENGLSELRELVSDAGFEVSKILLEVKEEKNILEKEIMPAENAEALFASEFEFAV